MPTFLRCPSCQVCGLLALFHTARNSICLFPLLRHVQMGFWPQFCTKAGVFCMGEVFGGLQVEWAASFPLPFDRSDVPRPVAQYQGHHALDSVLNFPMYSALTEAFKIPGPQNMTAVQIVFENSKAKFRVITIRINVNSWHKIYDVKIGYRPPWEFPGKSRRFPVAQPFCRPSESVVSLPSSWDKSEMLNDIS